MIGKLAIFPIYPKFPICHKFPIYPKTKTDLNILFLSKTIYTQLDPPPRRFFSHFFFDSHTALSTLLIYPFTVNHLTTDESL